MLLGRSRTMIYALFEGRGRRDITTLTFKRAEHYKKDILFCRNTLLIIERLHNISRHSWRHEAMRDCEPPGIQST
jgi:hypothetical protein